MKVDHYSELAEALGCDCFDSHESRVETARELRAEVVRLRAEKADARRVALEENDAVKRWRSVSVERREWALSLLGFDKVGKNEWSDATEAATNALRALLDSAGMEG